MNTNRKAGRIILEVVMVILSLLFLYPLFLTIINSLKSFSEVMTDVIALPKHLVFGNYSYVWKFINYPKLFLNNFVIKCRSSGYCVHFIHSSLQAGTDEIQTERGDLFPLHYADADSVPIDHADRSANR